MIRKSGRMFPRRTSTTITSMILRERGQRHLWHENSRKRQFIKNRMSLPHDDGQQDEQKMGKN
eukprot:GSA25T00019826001.1